MQRFKEKSALIAIGIIGVGFATAKHIISGEGKPTISGRSSETVYKAVKRFVDNGSNIMSKPSSIEDIALLQELVKQFAGNIDLLFVNILKSLYNYFALYIDTLF